MFPSILFPFELTPVLEDSCFFDQSPIDRGMAAAAKPSYIIYIYIYIHIYIIYKYNM